MAGASQVNLRLGDASVQLLDNLAEGLGLSRSETVRYALHELERSKPAERRNRFADSLRKRFGRDAALRVELDDDFAALATVDGQHRDEVYVFEQATRFGDEDYVQLWIGDPETDDVRIFLGIVPARAGVPIIVQLSELSAAMKPRAVAWFVESS
jgi:Arc/MetJ-type ribon-helix-helix transcriptional regulator